MTLTVVDIELLSVFDGLLGEHPTDNHLLLLLACRKWEEAVVGEVVPEVGGEVVLTALNLCENYIWFAAKWRVVHKLTQSVRVEQMRIQRDFFLSDGVKVVRGSQLKHQPTGIVLWHLLANLAPFMPSCID
jgi:hypothetical protein